MKRIITGLMMVLATVMSFCAQARTITNITENRTSGVLVSLTLTFSADTTTEWLHMAYGHDVGGDTYASWEHVEYIAEVNSSTTTLTVPVPADFGPQGTRAIRFFLGAVPELNYDYDVEYAESNGTAQNGVELPFHITFGQTFTMVWRQASLTGLTSEDKGWGSGKGSGASDGCFTGAGRRKNNRVEPWIKGGNRILYKNGGSETFPLTAVNTETIFEEKAYAGAPITYSMTELNGANKGTVWAVKDKDNFSLNEDHDTGANIFIFRGDANNPYYGKKAIYSVKLTNSDGMVVFNVFPVVKGGVVYFRDVATGTLYGTPNPATDQSLVAGPQVEPGPRGVMPTTINAMSTVYSSIGKPEIELSTASLCSDYRIKVDYNVLDLGSSASADVYVRYGDTADDLKSVKVAEGVGTGLGSAYLPAVDPNKTYYVRVYAVAGGVTGETSPAQMVVAPALPLEGPGGGNWKGVAISEVTRTAGVQTGVTLKMSNTVDAKLYAAYGATFGGSDTSNWEHVDFVATISAGTTSYDYTLPQGWGTTIKFVRFFIANDKTATTPFTIYKSLASDGNKQGIEIPRHLKGGDTFELVWRQYDTTVSTTEDKGWGTGKSDRNVTGGGRRRGGYINAYINGKHRDFYKMPALTDRFPVGDLTTEVTYKDVAVMSDPVDYTMTALDGANAGAQWKVKDPITMPDGENYDSSYNIYLYRDYASENWGKKAISSAFLRNKDGIVDFYLIPVKDADGVYCFFDLISGSYLKNLSNTAFIPSDETLTMADFDLVACSGTAVAEQAGKPALSDDIEVSGTDVGDSVVVSGTLAQAGSGSCTIAVETSSTEDFATYASFTDGAKTYGAGDAYSITVTTEPGTKVYYRVRATDSSSQAIVSSVGSFTTLGASAAEMKTAPVNTKESVTIVATVTTVGVGETSVWIEWSVGSETYENATDAQTFTSASESLDASFTFDVPAYGTLYYRVCCSNEYKTWSFTQTPQPKTGTVVNNANYTWNNTVTEGNWNDAASWTSDGAIAYYPDGNSTARFDGTTARVTLTTDANAKTLTMDGVFDLTFDGAHSLTANNVVAPKTSNWKLKLDNANLYSSENFVCDSVTNVLLSVDGKGNAREFKMGGTFVIAGASNRVEVAGGAHVWPAGGKFCVGGEASVVVFDNGSSYGAEFYPGDYVAYETVAPKVIVKGANPRFALYRGIGSWKNPGQVGAEWEFEVPLAGYTGIPLEQSKSPEHYFPREGTNGGWQRLSISINSPFMMQAKGLQTLNQQLVYWTKGIETNLLELVKVPHGGRWYYSYGTDKANPLWEPAKAGDRPTGLWVELKAQAGLMFIIR